MQQNATAVGAGEAYNACNVSYMTVVLHQFSGVDVNVYVC